MMKAAPVATETAAPLDERRHRREHESRGGVDRFVEPSRLLHDLGIEVVERRGADPAGKERHRDDERREAGPRERYADR